jgi:tetratricopeptide (TPR) repeat protein
LKWAEALLLQGKCLAALEELKRGSEQGPSEIYRKPLAIAHAASAATLVQQGKLATDEQWLLVERGLRLDPKNILLQLQLIGLSHDPSPVGAKARLFLRRFEAEEIDSATLPFFLAQDALASRQFSRARAYFERALALAPNNAIAANNLAYLLAWDKTPDLERALHLINTVLKQHPSTPQFRDTRGQILVKMGRWQEAVVDLEHALPALAKDRNLHVALSKAYEQIGKKEGAAEHRRLAAALPGDDGPAMDEAREAPLPLAAPGQKKEKKGI